MTSVFTLGLLLYQTKTVFLSDSQRGLPFICIASHRAMSDYFKGNNQLVLINFVE